MTRIYKSRWRLAQFLEIRWWRWYLRNKPVGDYLAAKKAYWHKILSLVDITIPEEANVLEAGCGPAGIFTILERQKVLAIDPLLEQYQDQLPHFNHQDYPNSTFQAETLEDFQSDQTFDYIFCLNVINHVSNWDRCLDQLTTFAQPGTQLLLAVDVHKYKMLWPIFRHLPGDMLHPQQHMRKHYVEAMQKRGWLLEHEHVYKSDLIFDYWLGKFSKA